MPTWDDRYEGETYFFGTAPNDFLRDMADRIPAGPVLCLAEGEGRNAIFLASRGFAVTGVDLSPVGLAKAQALAKATGVEITTEVADLSTYEIGAGAWAGIVSIFAHLPSEIRAPLHCQVVAGLRPGGVFVLEAYTPRQIPLGTGGPRDPDMMPTAALLRQELAGLDLEIAEEIRRDVIEGSGHTGAAEVVRVFARKPASA